MEASLENDIPLVILDRPNPNGFYVDGPVLEPAFRSFVGMQPIPIVHGMTIGEYASMLMGERWLSEAANKKLDAMAESNAGILQPPKNINTYIEGHHTALPAGNLKLSGFIIPCLYYTHDQIYELPVNPSPNLKEMQSVYWYPSTCFFEGTLLSEGRGT
jgi:uncharacterized protein YbbC (DUF1343 family)